MIYSFKKEKKLDFLESETGLRVENLQCVKIYCNHELFPCFMGYPGEKKLNKNMQVFNLVFVKRFSA